MRRVRPALTGDIPYMLAIARKCGLSQWSAKDYEDEIARADSILLVVDEVDADLYGFIAGRVVPGESDQSADSEIYNIGVLPNSQYKGSGSALLSSFFSICRSRRVARIWLEVRRSNTAARRFYAKNRFEESSVRPSFYNYPIEDAIVMCREVPPGLSPK